MREIYWLIVLGNFRTVVVMIFATLIFVGIVSVFLYASETATAENREAFLRYLKKMLLSIVCTSVILCFLPSKEDLLAIYGIGGTIDYIQSNDKAKELPDKVVDALTEYLENVNKDTDESK